MWRTMELFIYQSICVSVHCLVTQKSLDKASIKYLYEEKKIKELASTSYVAQSIQIIKWSLYVMELIFFSLWFCDLKHQWLIVYFHSCFSLEDTHIWIFNFIIGIFDKVVKLFVIRLIINRHCCKIMHDHYK